MSEELYFKGVSELSQMLDRREISAVELAQAFIDRKNAVDPKVGAFLSADESDTLDRATQTDKRIAAGEKLGMLDGIPVGLKDVLAVRGQKLTCASKMLENYVSPYTGTAMKNLESRGAVFFGRLNMDEYAMGSSCENSAFQKTRNPWNLECIPGGSSGGSAAAVAAGECVCSLGSDTGGSIRQPASLCGIVGMKPTYGLVSRYGLAAFASSLDQIGPFARSVKDAAILLNGVAGYDRLDSTSVKCDIPDYAANLSADSLKGKKIGVPKEYFGEGIDSEVRALVEKAIANLKADKPAGQKFGQKTVISRERPGSYAYEVVTAALRPQTDKLPAYTGVQTPDGSYVVIEVQSSKKIEATPEQLAMRKAELAQLYSNPEQAAFISGLEAKFGTQILKDEYKPGYKPSEDELN